MKTPDSKIIVIVLVGMLSLSVATWRYMSASGRRLEQPQGPGTVHVIQPEETTTNPSDHTAQTTRNASDHSGRKTGRSADRGDPEPFDDPYACGDDCPPGYDVFNTTGTEAEARWLHAAGFPTPAEYESLTRDEAALAEGRRRALAGDARAAGILGAYYLEQEDYSETLTMATLGAAACNVFALRVSAQRQIEEAELGRPTGSVLVAAINLQAAYLLGDQDAAVELGSLLRATNMGREVIGTFTNVIMPHAAARLDGYRELNPVDCQYPGLRPTPR